MTSESDGLAVSYEEVLDARLSCWRLAELGTATRALVAGVRGAHGPGEGPMKVIVLTISNS